MDTEASATHNHTQTIERKRIKRRASEAGVDIPESAAVDTILEQLRNDMERLAKQNHEAVMTLAKQNHDKIAATLSATLSTMRQENNERFARALEAMQTRIDARSDAPENSKSSSSSGRRKGNEQNSIRSVATDFTNHPRTKKGR